MDEIDQKYQGQTKLTQFFKSKQENSEMVLFREKIQQTTENRIKQNYSQDIIFSQPQSPQSQLKDSLIFKEENSSPIIKSTSNIKQNISPSLNQLLPEPYLSPEYSHSKARKNIGKQQLLHSTTFNSVNLKEQTKEAIIEMEIEEQRKKVSRSKKKSEQKKFIKFLNSYVQEKSNPESKEFKLKSLLLNNNPNPQEIATLQENLPNLFEQFSKSQRSIHKLYTSFKDFISFFLIPPKEKKTKLLCTLGYLYKNQSSSIFQFTNSLQLYMHDTYSKFLRNGIQNSLQFSYQGRLTSSNPVTKSIENSYEQMSHHLNLNIKKEFQLQPINSERKESYRVLRYYSYYGDTISISLSDQQLDVVVGDIKKDIKIIGCAGSGKTMTLIARLKYLIDSGVDPSSIIVSTLTPEAGEVFSKKIAQAITPYAHSQLIIGNIEKIAYKFIKRSIERKSQQQFPFYKKITKSEYMHMWMQDIRNKPHKYKHFQFIFFDLFQDITELQYQILLEFKKLSCTLIIAGNDAQGIYGIQEESRIEIIRTRFKQDLMKIKNEEINEFTFTTNFRSSPEIINVANYIIHKTNNDQLIGSNMQFPVNSMEKIILKQQQLPHFHVFSCEQDQSSYIIKQIVDYISSGSISFKDIAILCETNSLIKKFEESVELHNSRTQFAYPEKYIFFESHFKKLSQDEESSLNDSVESLIPKKKNKLFISTISQSRDLEWQIVFILGCNDELLPMSFANKYKCKANQIIEEQRRLFQIGITRAKDVLQLCCVLKPIEKMTDGDFKNGKNKVSRFLAEIPRDQIVIYSKEIDEQYFSLEDGYCMTDYPGISSESKQENQEQMQEEYLLEIKNVIIDMTEYQMDSMNHFTEGLKFNSSFIKLYDYDEAMSQSLNDPELFQEMKAFLDLIITRMIGEQYQIDSAFINQIAINVILPQIFHLQLNESLLIFYIKHWRFLIGLESSEVINIPLAQEKFKQQYHLYNKGNKKNFAPDSECLNDLLRQFKFHGDISSKSAIELLNFNLHNLNPYFKESFEVFGIQFMNALSDFIEQNNPTRTIFDSIYKLSKCPLLLINNRQHLESNRLNEFFNRELINQIKEMFIKKFLDQFTFFECKKVFSTSHISCTIDIIADKNEIIFLKFQKSDTCQKAELLQYMFAAAFLRVHRSLDIKCISIFNVISGTINRIDLKRWTQHVAYLSQMNLIAKEQLVLHQKKFQGKQIFPKPELLSIKNLLSRVQINNSIGSQDIEIVISQYDEQEYQQEKVQSRFELQEKNNLINQLNDPIDIHLAKGISRKKSQEKRNLDYNGNEIDDDYKDPIWERALRQLGLIDDNHVDQQQFTRSKLVTSDYLIKNKSQENNASQQILLKQNSHNQIKRNYEQHSIKEEENQFKFEIDFDQEIEQEEEEEEEKIQNEIIPDSSRSSSSIIPSRNCRIRGDERKENLIIYKNNNNNNNHKDWAKTADGEKDSNQFSSFSEHGRRNEQFAKYRSKIKSEEFERLLDSELKSLAFNQDIIKEENAMQENQDEEEEKKSSQNSNMQCDKSINQGRKQKRFNSSKDSSLLNSPPLEKQRFLNDSTSQKVVNENQNAIL